MADRHQINDVLADYAWANDAKDEATLHAVFADDAVFSLRIAGVDQEVGPLHGRQAIVDFIYPTIRDQTDQRRHVIVNTRFVLDEAERAKVRAYLILNVINDGALETKSAGVYDIDLAVREGSWRITSMDLSLDLPF